MATVRDVLDALQTLAPDHDAYSFDKIGLQVGDAGATVERAVVSLDPSLSAVGFARENGASLLVSHHPVIWDPLTSLRIDEYKGRVLHEMVSAGIAFIAAHTNWDCAPGGVSDALAEAIGLQDVTATGSISDKGQTKIVVTVPHGSEEAVTGALSDAGAGVIGLYERCSFQTTGKGTFKPKAGANPTMGTVGTEERVEETRIEVSCPNSLVSAALAAMCTAHPYEEPAYDVYTLQSRKGQPISRIGTLPEPLSPDAFRSLLDERLDTKTLLCSPQDAKIQRVVVSGGAAADEWVYAKGRADAFVTGEVPHNVMVEASESGLAIAACGHFATENPGALRLAGRLAALTPGVEFLPYSPHKGTAGSPL